MPPDVRDGPRPVTGDRPKQIATASVTRRPVTGGRRGYHRRMNSGAAE